MVFLLGAIVGAVAVKSVPAIDRAATILRDWLYAKVRQFHVPPGQGE